MSVVVIGRNEGERLGRCFEAVSAALAGQAYELIYVDSSSSDESTEVARAAGASILTIGPEGMSAAAARNAGWRRARGRWVLFLDGDTELQAGFMSAARGFLQDASVAAVYGYRFEKNPECSVYQRLLDVEWLREDGEARCFGGDVLVRRQALVEARGFDASLRAGEEPELSRRLRGAGWKILSVEVPMTAHDLAMTHFSQYWKRARRTGQAFAEVSARFARTRDPFWRRESLHNVRQFSLWTALSVFLVAGIIAGVPVITTAVLVAGLAVCLRTASLNRHRFPKLPWALLYGFHAQFQHLPIFLGQLEVWLKGQGTPLVYKETPR